MRLPDLSMRLQAQAGTRRLKRQCKPRVSRVVMIRNLSAFFKNPLTNFGECDIIVTLKVHLLWGYSSVGRALASHVRGHGFESRTLHHCPQSPCLWGFSLIVQQIVQHFAYRRLNWALFLYADAGWQGCRSTSPQIHHEKTAENRKQVVAPAVAQKQLQTSLSSAGDGPLLFQMSHNCQPNDAKPWEAVYPASQFLYN